MDEATPSRDMQARRFASELSMSMSMSMLRGSPASSPAPALDVSTPVLDVSAPVLDISTAPRGARLRVRSRRQGQIVYLYVRPEADVQALELAGQRLPGRTTARTER